ncbi:hypothetical protein [Pseudomonas sp. LRF_L74]|uniref:hypothetical protein n=1 Tax=Pseudomonas sp. LRF_L74 TaxID=3369422 RepID=UPI003F5F0758
MAGFGSLVDDMDDAVMDSLSDDCANYCSRTGVLIAEGIPVIIDKDVERVDEVAQAIDRVRTHTVQKRFLDPFDRQGYFEVAGKAWHIDGIQADDGHMITLYVKP